MSVPVSDFAPMMTSVKEVLDLHLPDSYSKLRGIATCSPLLQNAFTVIKNMDYSFFATQFGVNDLPHMISSRVSHLEATLISLASTVHNLFFALLYTFFVCITAGLSQTLATDCGTHWVHFTYGLASTGIGLVGVFTPYYSAGLNILFFRHLWRSFLIDYKHDLNLFEAPLIRKIQIMVKRQQNFIFEFTRNKVDDMRYQNEFKPSLILYR